MREYQKITKQQLIDFIVKYESGGKKLEVDICGICDPMIKTYNDFSLGLWPESVVAKEKLSEEMPEPYREPNEYFILS